VVGSMPRARWAAITASANTAASTAIATANTAAAARLTATLTSTRMPLLLRGHHLLIVGAALPLQSELRRLRRVRSVTSSSNRHDDTAGRYYIRTVCVVLRSGRGAVGAKVPLQ
jgi:hypothetical protein